MLGNYVRIALRELWRNKSYTLLNLTGLAVGIAACLLVFLYVRFELSFDTFHEKGDRIYRIVSFGGFADKSWGSYVSGDPVPEMRSSYTDVEDAAKMMRCGPDRVVIGGEVFRDLQIQCTESNFFNIFSFDLTAGDPASALDEPGTAVITRSLAERLFKGEDPIGKTLPLRFDSDRGVSDFRITGLMEDLPPNTHLSFNLLLSYASLRSTRRCLTCGQAMYTLLREGASPEILADRVLKHVREIDGKDYVNDIALLPISDLHFSSVPAERQGDVRYVYILSAIAVVILLMACANYMNLATARSTQRSKEVGVRKALGAYRGQLAGQFLLETVILTLFSLPIAFVLLALGVPAFNELAGTELALLWEESGVLLSIIVGLLFLVALAAGSYPALYLSGFQPVAVLRGRMHRGLTGARLRKGLVVFQFIVFFVMIVFTAVILTQMRYVQQRNLGFDAEHMLLITVADSALSVQPEVVKEEFLRHPAVRKATAGFSVPGMNRFTGRGYVHEMDGADGPKVTFVMPPVDDDFLETMGIPLRAGRNISMDFGVQHDAAGQPVRSRTEGLINEAGLTAMGWSSPEDALGQEISGFRIVGVIPDFHFASLHEEIAPLILEQNRWGRAGQIALRIDGRDLPKTIDALRKIWTNELGALQPFEYTFLRDEMNDLYAQERRSARVFAIASGLAIFIACLGLFGLAAFSAQQRTKEIGIRKVLGASVGAIVSLLVQDYGKLILAAFVLGAPVSYLIGRRWLEDFAYRTEVHPAIFVVVLVLALVIAFIATGYQSARAALRNPADTLRCE